MRRLCWQSAAFAVVATAASVLAACSSSVGTAPPAPTSAPGVSVTVGGQPAGSGVSVKAGSSTPIAVVAPGGGPYVFTIGNVAVARLALASGSSLARRHARVVPALSQTLTSQDGKVDLIAVGPGRTTLTIANSGGMLYSGTVVVTGSKPTPTPTPTPKPTATPTASPTPTPTAVPPGGIALTPNSLTFTSAGQVLTFTASESGYSGSFGASSGNTAIATVNPSSGSGTFTVTAVAAGTTTIVVTGAPGESASVSISVTTTGGGIH